MIECLCLHENILRCIVAKTNVFLFVKSEDLDQSVYWTNFKLCQAKINPCPAEPKYTLSLQTV